MSAEFSPKIEGPVTPEAIDAKLVEYQAWRAKQHDDAMARLESPHIEPSQHAAYRTTLAEMLALPLSEVVWPDDDPRYKLHRAMGYGQKLLARRSEVEARFADRVPLEQVFDLNRYALAALHAFKHWRDNPEPAHSFAQVLSNAAQKRELLLAVAAALIGSKYIRAQATRHFDGGVTLEAVGCDLFMLAGVLREVLPRLDFTPLKPADLVEAEVLADSLLRTAVSGVGPNFWEPTLLYARAFTLVDRAAYHAELVLSEFHNEERDPTQQLEWNPGCLFCSCSTEQQRHHRHAQSLQEGRERSQFVTTTLTAVLRRKVVQN